VRLSTQRGDAAPSWWRVSSLNYCSSTRPSNYDLCPRVLRDDAAFRAARGGDYIFAPPDDEMYPEPQRAFVEVGEVSEHLCGQTRPSHFRGVATAVLFETARVRALYL
jgi:pantothenate synthetase